MRWYGLLLFKFFKSCLPKILHGLFFIIDSWQGKKEQREQRTPFSSWYETYVSSVIKQKGESQNGRFKTTKYAKFSEKSKHFLPPDTHPYLCVSGGKKYSFFEKFGPFKQTFTQSCFKFISLYLIFIHVSLYLKYLYIASLFALKSVDW